jgi:hypothetical protein
MNPTESPQKLRVFKVPVEFVTLELPHSAFSELLGLVSHIIADELLLR